VANFIFPGIFVHSVTYTHMYSFICSFMHPFSNSFFHLSVFSVLGTELNSGGRVVNKTQMISVLQELMV
jgi:hypothetical protein